VPLEVRQIGIRMAVGDAGADGESAASDERDDQDGEEEDERALLIEQCVAAVLDELARRVER
jgi:hypothetical protein